MLNFFFSEGNLELPKRGKTRVPKSRVDLVLHLIGRTVAKVLMTNYRAKKGNKFSCCSLFICL